MNDESWTKIYSSSDNIKVALLMGKLHEGNVPSVDVNKKDSMYQTFGEIELMVPSHRVDEARKILEKYLDEMDQEE